LEEAWEPLLAIADLAGGAHPDKARAAAVDLAGEGDDEATSSHVLLLALRDLFSGAEAIATRDVLAALNENEELPFGSWNDGKGLKSHGLARMLKRYRISKPRAVRIGGQPVKGYRREWFEAAWERYGGSQTVTSVTTQCSSGFSGFPERLQPPRCNRSQEAENPRHVRDVTDVTDQKAPTRPHGLFAPSQPDQNGDPDEPFAVDADAELARIKAKFGDAA
jgi:putative DNA primase/helicase